MLRDFLILCARIIALVAGLAVPVTLLTAWIFTLTSFVLALVAMALAGAAIGLAVLWDSLAADPFWKPWPGIRSRQR